jgi:hypothetical protein
MFPNPFEGSTQGSLLRSEFPLNHVFQAMLVNILLPPGQWQKWLEETPPHSVAVTFQGLCNGEHLAKFRHTPNSILH